MINPSRPAAGLDCLLGSTRETVAATHSLDTGTLLPIGSLAGAATIAHTDAEIAAVFADTRQAFAVTVSNGAPALALCPSPASSASRSLPIYAWCPSQPLNRLGDGSFLHDVGIQYAYAAGSMANGIASVALVEALARARVLSFFGAAGLAPTEVEKAIDQLGARLDAREHRYGFNLIHSPNEPELEAAIVDLYLRRGIRLVEASAYLDLTLPLIRYRTHGITRDAAGHPHAPNRVIGKVSRVEVATKFLSPPPARFLSELVARGELSPQQAELAAQLPVAQDITAEADSGGHTDNRPALALLPAMLALRDRLAAQFNYAAPLRVGAAGGIATPAAVAAAFAMGAAYVMTGSINQACRESGSSDIVRDLLAEAAQADVVMAPAADMFEMGVKVQVLKRGTLFGMRAARLYEIYRSAASLDDIAPRDREQLEKQFFRASLGDVWRETAEFFRARDAQQLERAERDPKHKMALVFRWYLGKSSRWANSGVADRKVDFQVWCGPAMGAFNEWTKGSCLERAADRNVVAVAFNLLYGAALVSRAQMLRSQGIRLSASLTRVAPRSLAELEPFFAVNRGC